MVLAAIAIVVGILLGESMFGAGVLFRLIPMFLLIAAFVVFVILKKTRRFSFIAIGILIGFLGICGVNDIYSANTKIGTYEGVIQGRVSGEITVDEDGIRFFIEDVYAGDEKLKYEAYVVLTNFDEYDIDFNAGDTVTLVGTLKANEHKPFDSYHAYDVAKKEGYVVYSSYVEKVAEGELHPLERIPYKIKQNFYSRLDSDTAGICTALILGDKEGLDENLYDDISSSGLAHVLAVSGLHITTLSTALFFILRKSKINSKVALVIVFLITLFYCFLCDFTASSLRALIMMTILNFATAFGKKKDTLSSISLAAVLILAFRPTALFESGFLMSFSAVLGIVFFFGKFHVTGMKLVRKISPEKHYGKIVSEGVSLSLSANVGTYPFVAYFFGKIPVLFMLSNLIILPYLMFIYVFLLINTVFSLIVCWTGNLILFKFLLLPFRMYVLAIGSLSFATVPVAISVIGIVGFFIVMLLVSRFVFLTFKERAILSVIIITVALALSAVVGYVDALKTQDVEVEEEARILIQTAVARGKTLLRI